MKLAALNEAGIDRFTDFLVSTKSFPSNSSPEFLLSDGSLFEKLVHGAEIDESRIFSNRYDFAEYSNSVLGSDAQQTMSAGLWSWMTIVYFDQICPIVNGSRKILDIARYVPAKGNYRKFYRHLLSGPFHAYRAHLDNPGRVRVALTGPLYAPGELAEQLLAGQERMTNRAVIDVATSLYLDTKSGSLKRGAGGKAAGSPRRLVDVLNQFDLTYDLYSMTAEKLLEMLPLEFDRFRRTAQ